jgi:hypothetical protein
MRTVKKLFERVVHVYFYVGVNVIGLPEIVTHTIRQKYSHKKAILNPVFLYPKN